jgi:hypothetical protein
MSLKGHDKERVQLRRGFMVDEEKDMKMGCG